MIALPVWPAIVAAAAATPATIAALPPDATRQRGAARDFVEYEAENGTVRGAIIGPDRTFGTLAAEASGRRAVRLEHPDDSVGIVLGEPADALTIRYAIPDADDGRGRDTALEVFADGQLVGTFALTSRYGWFYGRYPFSNRPADGGAHHFYDHARLRLDRMVPAGTHLSFQREADDATPWISLDLIDAERVPAAKAMPAGAIAVRDFGADPSGRTSAIAAFRAAIAAGRRSGRPVWIAPGTYRIDGHLTVDRVTLAGAGPWRSVLTGHGVGLYGRSAPGGSHDVTLRDFAVIGSVDERKDREPLAGIGGALNDSRIEDLWLQHEKVGIWLDGPMRGLAIRRVRIFDQTADGINLHRGVTDATIEDCFIRNTGDDGIASWSQRDENADIAIRRNTVIAPILANGIALYGGRDITVSNNLVADTLTQGGGLHLGTRFAATPFRGTIALDGNMVIRGGSFDPNWRFGVGALWFYALDHPIAGARIVIRDTVLRDSSEEAVQLLGARPIRDVRLDGLTIDGAGGPALRARGPGEIVMHDVVASDVHGGIVDDGHRATIRDEGGNRGIARTAPSAP